MNSGKKGEKPKYVYFKCIKRQWKNKNNCGARLKITNYELGENGWKVEPLGKPHNHDQGFWNHIRKDINAELKSMAKNYPKTDPIEVVNTVLKESKDFNNFYERKSGRSTIPLKSSMKKTVQRARVGIKAPPVTDPEFDFNEINIILSNFFQEEVRVKKARHFIFFDAIQLRHMSEAYAWYVDATFKIVKDPVKQLLAIHVLITCGDQKVSVPVCFVLMYRRRMIDYKAVLKTIYQKCIDYMVNTTGLPNATPRVMKIMADFEIALWNAFRQLSKESIFPTNLIMKGCYFHFAQAVFRKVMSYGLKSNYYKKDNSGGRLFMKWLMNLVLLPNNLIEPTFFILFDKIKNYKCPKLIKLFDYYLRNWIKGKNWSITEICQWNCSVRTNNDAERFHMKLMTEARKPNMSFYDIVNLLGDVANRVLMDAKNFSMGLMNTFQRKQVKAFEAQLKTAQDQLRKGDINALQFLNLLTTEENNRLVDETWCINHSRIEVEPETDSDEDPDDPDSEE